MGQQYNQQSEVKGQITDLLELKKAVLAHDEMSIEIFFQTMIDEGMIHLDMVTNPHAKSTMGEILIDIDKSRTDYVPIICPFCDKKDNGAGRLNIEEQYYKCFKGNCVANKPMSVFDLYMVFKLRVDPMLLATEEVTKSEFPKAVREIADYLGIPYSFGAKKLTEEEKEQMMIRQIREEFAMIYHQALLKHKYAKDAVNYMLETRGFAYGVVPFQLLIQRYKIGFAPGWSYGYQMLKHKYTDDILIKSGVVRYAKNKSNQMEIRDFLSGAIVLPYYSKQKINNLYGRSLFAKDPRFRHLRLKGSVDIPINFDVAKHHKELIFVEGELSWLSMVALGYENTLGNRGTNGLLNEHIAAIKSIRDKTDGEKCAVIYLCFDPDDAGQAAIAKTGKKLIDEGFDVRVIRLQDGDPNDFLVKHKHEAKAKMDQLFKEAISYEAFMIGYTLERANLTKDSSLADILSSLKKIQPFIDKTPSLQLAVIAQEIVNYLQCDFITLELLYKLWFGIEPKEEEINQGFQEAIKYFWVFGIEDKERFHALKENGSFKNIVWIQDVQLFTKELKKHPHIHSILLDRQMKQETIERLFHELNGFEFKYFVCDSNELLKTAKKEQLVSMVKSTAVPPLHNTNKKEVI